MGEIASEEINRATARPDGAGAGAGDDYGWDDCEGLVEFGSDEGDADTICEQHTLPLFEWEHVPGECSAIIGGYVYRGLEAPAWHGLYIGGDWCGSYIFVLGPTGDFRMVVTVERINSFGTDAAGELYATSDNGDVHRLMLLGPAPAIIEKPT